jgi:hypothetical protein
MLLSPSMQIGSAGVNPSMLIESAGVDLSLSLEITVMWTAEGPATAAFTSPLQGSRLGSSLHYANRYDRSHILQDLKNFWMN